MLVAGRDRKRFGRRLLVVALCAICVVPVTVALSATITYVTPAAMAVKIHGSTPQLQTGNTGVPSTITASVCHGTGTPHAKKFNTFKCSATWIRGTVIVWARALPKNQFCASITGLSACPATPALPGDPRLCHSSPGAPPTADPNYCALVAAEQAVTNAMKVTFQNTAWTLRDTTCKGQNVTWSCEYSSQGTFGTYYDSTISFGHSTGSWVATLSTTTRGSSGAPIACTVHPASTPAGQSASWSTGPPATCNT